MSRFHCLCTLTLIAAGICGPAMAAPPKTEAFNNSNLDGELFYEMLVSEMSVQVGDPATAYAMMLDAARKSNSARLYKRAVEMADRARNGEAALQAARAWARAQPSSKEANGYQLQILLSLNKIAETQEPLKRELATMTPTERALAINLIPRYFARTTDRKLAALVVEKALSSELGNRTTGPAAWAAIGTMRLQAEDVDGALEATRRGVGLDPESEDVILLAIALIGPKAPAAKTIVRKYLDGKPTPDVRMAYARTAINTQRYDEAYIQMQLLTAEKPDLSEAWLLRGSLELQDAKLALAESSLKTYVALNPPPQDPGSQNATMGRGLVQAYLLLSQVAEQDKRLDEAKAYLDRIISPKDTLRIQRRHAAILVRQGKLAEARETIRNIPEQQASDALEKINAEVQLLRDAQEYAAAHAMLLQASAQYPDETELVYDLAMMAEKLGKLDEMEKLLRQVIAAKPDYHHAYNALGYSLADRNIRLDEARQLITQALAFAPDDPFIVDSMAWVEYRSGNAAEAIRLLQGAFQARPDAEIAAHLGEVLWSVGQQDQASAIWKEGVGLNPQNETLRETMRRLRGTP
ncbi:MAG: tetratricopeptide repeat protein [Pseudomonadota bacterium]